MRKTLEDRNVLLVTQSDKSTSTVELDVGEVLFLPSLSSSFAMIESICASLKDGDFESICASLKDGDFESEGTDGKETELDLLLILGGGLVEVEDLAMSAAFLVHCGEI